MTATTIHLSADVIAEIHAPTIDWPLCLRLSDGERSCAVDLSVVAWQRLRAQIDALVGVVAEPTR